MTRSAMNNHRVRHRTPAGVDRCQALPVWAEIDLPSLGRNLATLRGQLPQGMAVYGVVKADAYGHGAVIVARALQDCGIDGLVVADVTEGAALRRAGIALPILVLDPALEHQAALLTAHRLTATVTKPHEARVVAMAATQAGKPVPVHVRVNTGLAGFGAPRNSLVDLLGGIARMPGLRLEGLYTHLSGSYSENETGATTELSRFADALSRVDVVGLRPPLVHVLSSPALEKVALSAGARRIGCTMVRIGAALYGIRMLPGPAAFPFAPVMTVKARVTRVAILEAGDPIGYAADAVARRRMRVAMVSAGFSDCPYLHGLVNGEVLIRGGRVPILSAAFMSCLLADVSAVPDIRRGDEVVLIGRQDAQSIPVEDVAARCGLRPSAVPILGSRVIRHCRGGSGLAVDPDGGEEGAGGKGRGREGPA